MSRLSHIPWILLSYYIFANACNFKNNVKAQFISDALKSSLKLTLIIDCSCRCNSGDNECILISCKQVKGFNQKSSIIFICADDSATVIENEIDNLDCIMLKCTWSNLDDFTKKKFLEKEVDFEKYPVQLCNLIKRNSNNMTSVNLTDLLETKIKIGEELPTSYGYDRRYFIDRTLSFGEGKKIFNTFITETWYNCYFR